MGLPGIRRKAELPVAAPLQAGAVTAFRAVVPGELAESVKDRTDPSDKVMEKGWPPPKTVALT